MAQKLMQKFGKYEVLEEVGRGAMGIVYKARDPFIGRLVALKTVTPGLLAEPELLKRFYREAQAAGGLQHPNIVTIFDMGEVDGLPYIAMEFVEGESLEKLIAGKAVMPLAQKLKVVTQLCRGLDYAHKRGVIHRDIKPANILVRDDATVKVVDFGIVHLMTASMTSSGMVLGTLSYMSPEQLRGEQVDARSDIFSVGTVMYELFTYRKAFDGPSISAVMFKITGEDPVPLTELTPEVPPALGELVKKCLRKNPEERIQSLEDLALELEPLGRTLTRDLVAAMVREGQELLQKRDFTRAEEVLRNALMLDSSHDLAKSLMSQAQAELKRLSIAVRVGQYLDEGQRLLNESKYAEASRAFEEALKLDSQHGQARAQLETARKEMARAAEVRRGLVAGRRALGEGDLTLAESELKRVLTLDDRNSEATVLLTEIQQERAAREERYRRREAIWHVRKLLSEEHYDEAVEQLEYLQKEFPGEEEIQRLLETARQKVEERRQVEEAETACFEFPQEAESTRLHELAERRRRLESELAAVRGLITAQEYDAALDRAERLQREFPGEEEVQHVLQTARQKVQERRQVEEAVKAIKALLEERKYQEALERAETVRVEFPQEGESTQVYELAKTQCELAQRREQFEKQVEATEPAGATALLAKGTAVPEVSARLDPGVERVPTPPPITEPTPTEPPEPRPRFSEMAVRVRRAVGVAATKVKAVRMPVEGTQLRWLLVAAGAMVLMVSGAFLRKWLRPGGRIPAPGILIPVDVGTSPPGASIRINNEDRGLSPTRLELREGTYELQALKDGYEPAAASVTLKPGSPSSVHLTLKPLAPTLRLYSDLEAGKIWFDGQPVGELKDGQFVLDNVGLGKHTIKVSDRGAEATIDFEVAAAAMPVISSPVATKGLKAVLVSNLGGRGFVRCSFSPVEVRVDDQPAGRVGADGLNLSSLTQGHHKLTLVEGKDHRDKDVEIGSAPALNVFLNSDRNVGTLLVVTGEDKVRVFLNGKQYRTVTQRGQLRIPNLEVREYAVRVIKDGYQSEPEQRVPIRKGEETTLQFKLRPLPQVASLRIEGALPDTEIVLDGNSLGTVPGDGDFTVSPGEHTVELRKNGYKPRRIQKHFVAGEAVKLAQSEVALDVDKVLGIVLLNIVPASNDVTIRRDGESSSEKMSKPRWELSPGSYTVTARWSAHREVTKTVQVVAGGTQTVDLILPQGGMEGWDNPSAWTPEGSWFVHRGSSPVLFGTTPTTGRFVFSAMSGKGSYLQWVIHYTDRDNYVLFEIDAKSFSRYRVVNGKRTRLQRVPRGMGEKGYCTLQIDVMPGSIVHQLYEGQKFTSLDAWNEPEANFANGKFGFLIPRNGTLRLSNFRFSPQ